MFFNHRFSWCTHIEYLRKSLLSRLILIKCIAAKSSNAHPTSILNATRNLILAKIDYGLSIYGKTSKSQLNKLKPFYNTSIRLALGAFKTTPIKNLMAESGLPTLEKRFVELTSKLIPKIMFPTEQHLIKRISNLSSQTSLRIPSSILLALRLRI